MLGWIKSKFKKSKKSDPSKLYVDRLTYEILKSNDSFIVISPDVKPIYVEIKHISKFVPTIR